MIHENAGKSKCLMRKMICAGSMVNGWRLEMISAGIHHTGACASVFSAGARRFVCISGARGNAGSPVPPVHGECRFVCTSGARGKFHLIRRKQFPWEIAFATFPCIGDAVMPAAWPLAYCPPDAFALPAVGTQGMANRPSPEEGTQAFLRKARWWVSEANPDEVEVWRVAEEKTGRRGSMGILRVKDQAKSKYRDTPRERLSEVEVWGCTA